MKNEVKEILDKIKKNSNHKTDTDHYNRLNLKECSLLLEYITNLQEENKMYAQLKDEYEDIINKATKKAIHIQETFGYVLSDLIFLLQGRDVE